MFIPAYSAEHTLATFHTLREHMVPRIIGQDIESAEDLLGRLALIKGNQFARAALSQRSACAMEAGPDRWIALNYHLRFCIMGVPVGRRASACSTA